jgi:hypothetical protein
MKRTCVFLVLLTLAALGAVACLDGGDSDLDEEVSDDDGAPPWLVDGEPPPEGVDWQIVNTTPSPGYPYRATSGFGGLCGKLKYHNVTNTCAAGLLCVNGFPNASTPNAAGVCIACVRPTGYSWAGYADSVPWCSTHYDSFGVSYMSRVNGMTCHGGPYCNACTPDSPQGHDPGPDGVCNNGDDYLP